MGGPTFRIVRPRRDASDPPIVQRNSTTKVTAPMSLQQHPPHETLFRSTSIGGIYVANRIALAPMTRVSATAAGLPTDRIGGYYKMFVEGGFRLLITEGLYIDDQTSQGYFFQPGIANSAQAAAWTRVVDGVHAYGAKFFAQLMHVGTSLKATHTPPSPGGPQPCALKASS